MPLNLAHDTPAVVSAACYVFSLGKVLKHLVSAIQLMATVCRSMASLRRQVCATST